MNCRIEPRSSKNDNDPPGHASIHCRVALQRVACLFLRRLSVDGPPAKWVVGDAVYAVVSGRDETTEAKRVLIVCQLDKYANGLKPVEVERFLRERGHDVRLVNTYYLARASSEPSSRRNKYPALQLERFALYAIEVATTLFTSLEARSTLSLYYLLVGDYRPRSQSHVVAAS